ncbi:hypothetical protein [Arcticibacter sp. MXS-1]|uniref:hypothetical protein n=1 Tax=Arcticibacter sp. MXS-1 TaxID=3341726 RepID=UPI0035A97966
MYIDLSPESAYAAEQMKSTSLPGDVFIKKYAARIPPLRRDDKGKFEKRSLFTPVLFPVVKAGASPEGIYDELYIEAAAYSDGMARIVHANQPVSANLLAEEQDGFHPQKELGIRLGWDDEQLLIWYLRQLAKDENVNAGAGRLDAPLGISGFHVDVRDAGQDGSDWTSLNAVSSKGNMMLEDIDIGTYEGELPFQVYPVKLYGIKESNYWLPVYFANWNNHSLVIPDRASAEIYRNTEAFQNVEGVSVNRSVSLNDLYTPADAPPLRYGHLYHFKVRLADLTGGSPDPAALPDPPPPGRVALWRFKRYLAPQKLQIVNDDEIKHSTDDDNFTGEQLVIKRPLLGYPSVSYTGKYEDPVSLLKASVSAQLAKYNPAGEKVSVQIGLADPDVIAVAVKVEVATLQMDNLASDNGQENYITLYTCLRKFSEEFDSELSIPIVFKDYSVLNLQDIHHPFNSTDDDGSIAADTGGMVLPTCRDIRLTLRAVCAGDDDYWGANTADPDLNSRFGEPTSIKMRRNSAQETELFAVPDQARLLQAIYLQPDPKPAYLGSISVKETVPLADGLPDIVQRLAQQIDVVGNQLSLTSQKGEHLQFWCSNLIRHTLSPDSSSITFANKNELVNQWMVVTSLTLNRDWSWNGLDPVSFEIERKKSGEDNPTDKSERKKKIDAMGYNSIGDLELHRTASFQALQMGESGKIRRDFTKIVVIDVIDALPAEGKLPDTILVQYRVTPRFRNGIAPAEGFETPDILLPATVNPSQCPKIIGAGIALSPYVRNEKYSSTEARKRFLWLEFDQAPLDGRDELFARHLAYSPDQLLSNNHPELYETPQEPPLNLDPEYIRVVTPDSAHDHSGLAAMQRMEKSTDDGRHFYLLPLPPGLHSESAELFGFHTYEFRYGHSEKLWSTAQGRFGRPFRLTGLQHPAPNLLCTVTRDDKKVRVSAPYAMAVFNGRNVTANPPRTSLWCMLYAQVTQADGRGYRNILLDEQKLIYSQYQRSRFPAAGQSTGVGASLEKQRYFLHLALDREAQKFAETEWTNKAIKSQLELYGLPEDSPLSVICVEVLSHIRNIAEHIDNFEHVKQDVIEGVRLHLDKGVAGEMQNFLQKPVETKPDDSRPLSSQLGLYRILRTSPLTEVPFVCCTDCA